VLPCVRDDGGVLAPTCPELHAELAAQHRRISAQIEELETSRRLLADVLDR
jgi:hypothetical protein